MGARSKARKRAVDILFESDLRGLDPLVLLAERVGAPELPPVSDYTVSLVHGVVEHAEDINRLLTEQAHGWALARMPAVDRAVLRLGAFELLFSVEVDDAVAIDEAIELAKLLSTDDSPRFVNGVLGALAALPRGT
ncbi:MAG: transcription antitermination factor NusB [Pseudonocardiaceae bacterium]